MKNINFKIYIQQVYTKWKNFYYFIIVFILGTFISAFVVGQTITPFYIYSMYSYVFPPESTISSFKLIINQKELNTFFLLKGEGDIIRGNITRFIYLKNNSYKDKYYDKLKSKVGTKLPSIIYEQIFHYKNLDKDFLIWLKLFLENETGSKIKTLKIYSINLKVNNQFKPIVQNEVLIIDEKFNN